jgi:inorganic pyrophosphatase
LRRKGCSPLADIKTIRDLGKQFVLELEEFFVDYHKLSGERYRVLALKGRAHARKLVKSGMEEGNDCHESDSGPVHDWGRDRIRIRHHR